MSAYAVGQESAESALWLCLCQLVRNMMCPRMTAARTIESGSDKLRALPVLWVAISGHQLHAMATIVLASTVQC